jgi:hypothetical protein
MEYEIALIKFKKIRVNIPILVFLASRKKNWLRPYLSYIHKGKTRFPAL